MHGGKTCDCFKHRRLDTLEIRICVDIFFFRHESHAWMFDVSLFANCYPRGKLPNANLAFALSFATLRIAWGKNSNDKTREIRHMRNDCQRGKSVIQLNQSLYLAIGSVHLRLFLRSRRG